MQDDVVQPDQGQGAESVAVEPLTGTPWADDLNLLFDDAATRSKVDEYMRTKIQPHTTKLEQDLAGLKDAQRYYTDLQNDPGQTALNIIVERYGADAANEIGEYLNAQAQAQQAAAPPVAQLDPRVMQQFQEMQQQIQSFHEAQAESAYDQAMNTAIGANPDIDPKDLAIFVAQTEDADGLVDFDQGVANYRAFAAKFGKPAEQAPPENQPVLSQTTAGEIELPYPNPKTLDESTANLQAIMRAHNEAEGNEAPKTL